MLTLDLASENHMEFPGISIRRISTNWVRPVKEEIRREHWSAQTALGTALWLSWVLLWFDFSSELMFWNDCPCVLIDLVSVTCLCFLVGISKGSFGSLCSVPTVPVKKRGFSSKNTISYCTHSESPPGEILLSQWAIRKRQGHLSH